MADEDTGYGSKAESDSIGNQRMLINRFLDNHPELSRCQRSEFADDGYTGTNFHRPQFTQMMEKVKRGEIDLICVKDFSRFSRDYIETGNYGYIKNPDDPRFWVVEPEAAEVVRRIYRMALEGCGLAETAARLATDGVVNPTYYWRSRGTSRGGSKSTVEPTKWGHTTVKKILTLQEYCGDVINFKSYSKSYKMKKRIENPEENRAIFLNVHEAIIDRLTWEKVQALQKGTRRKSPRSRRSPAYSPAC